MIRKGSVIYDLFNLVINNPLFTVPSSAYLATAAVTAAKDGLLETGAVKDSKKILKGAIISLQWVVKIYQHSRSRNKDFKKVAPQIIDEKNFVELTNQEDLKLIVPKEYYDKFLITPSNFLSKSVKQVETDRKLVIGVLDGKDDNFVEIKISDKDIFYSIEDEQPEEIILSELKHGDLVDKLEGKITKVIVNKNKIGFLFKDHILECTPKSGTIERYKETIVSGDDNSIFSEVLISGIVDRTDLNNKTLNAKRPKIIFSEITRKSAEVNVDLLNYNTKKP